MKRKNFCQTTLYFTFLLFLTASSFNLSSYAQDTESAKYFPLAVGNIYVYYFHDYPIPIHSYRYKAEITKDTIIDGKKYFYCHNFPLYKNKWVRYDSATSITLVYSSNNGCAPYTHDKIVDSLSSRLNDECNGCVYGVISFRRCIDTLDVNIFGINTPVKKFRHDGLMLGQADYAKNIGLIYNRMEEPPGYGSSSSLVGCVLNGVVYGDTTLTGIQQISSRVPDKFSLFQNYPNPFNPTTKIKMGIAKLSDVKLVVYDALGREVSILVSEQLKPGIYEVEFNSSNYPSGVYLYRLSTGDFSFVKKMLLVK